MSLSTKIHKEIIEDEDDVPDEIEHDLIKDSVLEIASTNFKIDDDFDELPMGQIRRNIGEDLSTEYEGKPVSRKSFSQRNWMNDRTAEKSDSDEGSDAELSDDSVMDPAEFSDYGDDNDDDEDMSSGSDADNNLGDEEEESGKSDEESDTDRNDSKSKGSKTETMDIDIFSNRIKNIEEDIKKGNAIKNQLLLWESLIECRIKLQKGLVASNRLMQKDTFAEFKSQLSPEELSSVNSAYAGLVDLLENFIQLKECLLKKCPEYLNFKKGGLKGIKKEHSDEEITSESDENNSDKDEAVSDEEESEPRPKKRKTIKDYSDYLEGNSKNYNRFRDTVIQKWNDKTRVASGKIGISKFAILEQSTLKQIEQIMLDKDRLLKRTQTKRSKLPVLGKKEQEEMSPEDDEHQDDDELPQHQNSNNKEELDCEIFDDDDFYHKLLKDFIDKKTSDVTDPTQLGRQWTKLQKLRNKMKKKVDTRATKGRKLRYNVHTKLVNFMAPVPYSTWDDKVQQDLFGSLFGQASA